jgi:hypothetical protein
LVVILRESGVPSIPECSLFITGALEYCIARASG